MDNNLSNEVANQVVNSKIGTTGDPLDELLPVLVMMAVPVVLFVGAMVAAKIIAPFKPTKLKSTPYECGELPVGSAWSMFNVRFYVVGLIFIIFDVESVLMFPAAVAFKRFIGLGEGTYVLIIFISFVSVLLEGVAYCWKKGDLDWVKSYRPKGKVSLKAEDFKL